MYQEERIQQIQQLLEKKKRLSKKEIMEAFQISSDTAVCGKINLHTIAAQKYITPQAA